MHLLNIPKSEADKILLKLNLKAAFYFKTFIVNILLVTMVWLLSLTGLIDTMIMHFFHVKPEVSNMILMNLISFWKIANLVFFLAPGIAVCWMARHMKRHMK